MNPSLRKETYIPSLNDLRTQHALNALILSICALSILCAVSWLHGMWPADAVAYFIHWVKRNRSRWWTSFLGLSGRVVAPLRVFTVGRGMGIVPSGNGRDSGDIEAQRLRRSGDGQNSVELAEMRGALPV